MILGYIKKNEKGKNNRKLCKDATSENWKKKISLLPHNSIDGFFRHCVKNQVEDILHPLQETI
jgi:hypothetical protein